MMKSEIQISDLLMEEKHPKNTQEAEKCSAQ